MAEFKQHGNLTDWCHLCGQRFYPCADIRYPENAEFRGENNKYIRVCSNCAENIMRVCNASHDPNKAHTTFDSKLEQAVYLINEAVTGFSNHLHAKYADKLTRAIISINAVRSRYQ